MSASKSKTFEYDFGYSKATKEGDVGVNIYVDHQGTCALSADYTFDSKEQRDRTFDALDEESLIAIVSAIAANHASENEDEYD